ncbi:hypothetical protein B0A52_04929 [Exophiala mesophila]|uniref:Thioesterase domain-containing protein n=1 Tax=Exophiala mesophila TaxID=212818 RepID=A0A438N6T9_EXOME|nr:hypothetical protein B0A52_04929 [Exophiala mesophila]
MSIFSASYQAPDQRITPPDLAHFQSMPWTNAFLTDPTYRAIPRYTAPEKNDGHTLMGETWNTDRTIVHMITFAKASPEKAKKQTDAPSPILASLAVPTPQDDPTLITRFYTLGNGLNAHPSLLHGGVIATILDSTLGAATGIHISLPSTLAPYGPGARLTTFTVDLRITYKKPVKTPCTICARSWVVRSEGRKVFVKGWIGGEDGTVHSLAEGIWVMVHTNSKKGIEGDKGKDKGKL